MTDPSSPSPTVGARIAVGTVWMVGSRILIRSLGFFSTIILARLLVPEDFGIIAIGLTMMQLLTNLTDIGVSKTVVKYRNTDQDLLNTLFTFSLMRGGLTALILICISFFAEQLFNEPRAVWVFLGISVVPIIQGAMNPKFHEFERDLDLSKKFRLMTLSKVASVLVSIIVALVFRNFWAIIASLIVGSLVGTVLSYMMRPYRPRLMLKAQRDQFKFMGWLTGVSFVTALNHKLDVLMLPRLTDIPTTGAYYIGYQLVDLATVEVSMPAATAIYPGLAEQQDRPDAMKQTFLQSVEALGAIGLPIAFGVAFVAVDLIPLLLGAGWEKVITVLQIGAPFEALLVMMAGLEGFAIARGKVKLVFLRELIFFLVRTPLFIWATWHYGLLGAVVAVALGSFVKWCVCLGVYKQVCGGHFWEPLWQVRRSIASIAMMAIWFLLAKPYFPILDALPAIFRLVIDVIVGALVYIIAHVGLWHLERKPAGIEHITFRLISRLIQRIT